MERDTNRLKSAFEATVPQMPEDFTRRVMKQVGQHRQSSLVPWLLTAAAAIALLIVTGIALLSEEPQPELSQRVQVVAEEPMPVVVEPVPATIVREPMATAENRAVSAKRPSPGRPKAVAVAAEVHMTPIDSLTEMIARIEEKMQGVRDSCYITNVEKLIRADDRLQHLVNTLILDGIIADTITRVATIDNP